MPVSRHFQNSVKTYILGDADADYQQFYSFCEEKYKYEEPDEPNFVTIAKEARLNRMKNSKVSFIGLTLSRFEPTQLLSRIIVPVSRHFSFDF